MSKVTTMVPCHSCFPKQHCLGMGLVLKCTADPRNLNDDLEKKSSHVKAALYYSTAWKKCDFTKHEVAKVLPIDSDLY